MYIRSLKAFNLVPFDLVKDVTEIRFRSIVSASYLLIYFYSYSILLAFFLSYFNSSGFILNITLSINMCLLYRSMIFLEKFMCKKIVC